MYVDIVISNVFNLNKKIVFFLFLEQNYVRQFLMDDLIIQLRDFLVSVSPRFTCTI